MSTPAGDDVADADALMARSAAAIVDGVERLAAAWVLDSVTRVVDAWGRLDATERHDALARATEAGAEGTRRVAAELRAFFATDVADQRTTPLAIVRSLRREPTAVLQGVGIPAVERDEFDTRAFPDDEYGLVPHSLADLGDEDLAPMLMVWGVGKSKALRARGGGSVP